MVFLSIPNGKTLSIDVTPNATTISAFEQLVHQRTDVPQSFVRFSLRMRNPSHVLGDSKQSDSVLLSDLGVGRGAGKPSEADDDEEAEEKGYDENQKFDDFEGNDAGLFSNADYDEDDKGADAIWESIDQRMDSRRKDRREAKLKEEIKKYRASNPKITEQFADLKRKLHFVCR